MVIGDSVKLRTPRTLGSIRLVLVAQIDTTGVPLEIFGSSFTR